MNQHRKKLQLSVMDCSVSIINELTSLAKVAKCDLITLDYVNIYRVLHIQIEGPIFGINHYEGKLSTILQDLQYYIHTPENKSAILALSYSIQGKLFSNQEGFENILLWLESIEAKTNSVQVQNLQESGIHFQIDILIQPNISIRQMKEDFYELCDEHDVEAYIESSD